MSRRKSWIAAVGLLGGAVGLALAGACGAGDPVCLTPEYGCSDVAPDVVTPVSSPPADTYETDVNPIMEGKGCGAPGECHGGGERLFTFIPGATDGSAEMTANYESFVAQFTCFDPPKGPFAVQFIETTEPHQGSFELDDGEMATIQEWAALGEFPEYEHPDYGPCP